MAGPSVLMAATRGSCRRSERGVAPGVVNAGGSFGQFLFAPVAQAITTAAGWVVALQACVLSLLALPAAWVLRGSAVKAAGSLGDQPTAARHARGERRAAAIRASCC